MNIDQIFSKQDLEKEINLKLSLLSLEFDWFSNYINDFFYNTNLVPNIDDKFKVSISRGVNSTVKPVFESNIPQEKYDGIKSTVETYKTKIEFELKEFSKIIDQVNKLKIINTENNRNIIETINDDTKKVSKCKTIIDSIPTNATNKYWLTYACDTYKECLNKLIDLLIEYNNNHDDILMPPNSF